MTTSEHIAWQFKRSSADLLDQSLIKIANCVEQLTEDQVWWRPQSGMNSVGNLCVHLAGNLRQWGIVPVLGVTDERDRESEFCGDLHMSLVAMNDLLTSTVAKAKSLWLEMPETQLLQMVTIQGFEVTMMNAISHTSCHFVGHTHQIITMTRIQLGDDYRFHWSPEDDRGDVPI